MSKKKSSSLDVEEVLPQINALKLPLTGVDSHAHLDLEDLANKIEKVLENAKNAGVQNIGQVFLSAEAYHNNNAIFNKYQSVFFLLGIHPNDALNFNSETLTELQNIIQNDKRVKAIGEIGLDFYWKDVPPELQKEVFIKQLLFAKELSLPVAIHSRDAEQACLDILEELNFKNYPVLWHCFGGNKELADIIINNGWYISIPGVVTYPKNTELRETIKTININKIMLETDCPYLAPQITRGKINEPALTAISAQAIAEVLNIPLAELWTICGNNARKFFKI